MRYIDVVPGLRLRFASRDENFDEGVEIGLLAAQLASGIVEFTMMLAAGTLDQARMLATNMGYRPPRRVDERRRSRGHVPHRKPPAQTATCV